MNRKRELWVDLVFAPTDEELLNHYLYQKVVGKLSPRLQLPEIDLYNTEPSLIWERFGGIDGKDLYCFTVLNKKKSRVVRKVGSSGYTWSGETKSKQVFCSNDNTFIGSFKRFHYENPKLKNVVHHHDISWIMFEYTLNPKVVPNGVVHDSYVLCKIRKRFVKKKNNLVSTTTSIEIYDPNYSKSVDMDLGFNKHEIKKELLAFHNLESSQLQKDSRPLTNNQRHQIMRGTTQMDELYEHISKRGKLTEENKLKKQICNNNMELIQDETEFELWNGLEPIVPLEDFQSLSDSQYTEVCPLEQMECLDENLYNLGYVNPCLMTQMELYEPNLPNAGFAHLCNEFYDRSSNNVEPANTSEPKKMEFLDQNPNNLKLDNECKKVCDQNVNNVESADISPTTQMESYHPILDVKEFSKLLLSLQDQ